MQYTGSSYQDPCIGSSYRDYSDFVVQCEEMYKEQEDDISSIPSLGQLEKKASISCLEEFSQGYRPGRTMLKEGFFPKQNCE